MTEPVFGPIALRITEADGEYSFTEEIDVPTPTCPSRAST